MTPLPPCSSKYLRQINSVIFTTIQPETVDGKYNPLDTEGWESAWKIQCPMEWHANCIIRVCAQWLEIAANLYVTGYLILGIFSTEKRENTNNTVYC